MDKFGVKEAWFLYGIWSLSHFSPSPCFFTAQTVMISERIPCRASLVDESVKNLPAAQETWVRSLGREDALEKGMAIHSSILAWRILCTEQPGGLHPWSQKESGHDWATELNWETNTQQVSGYIYWGTPILFNNMHSFTNELSVDNTTSVWLPLLGHTDII